MKKILLTATVLLITSSVAFSHRQHVHQTCAVEGYNLLKKWIGGDVPPMTDHIGGVQGGSTDYVGTAPWQKGFITTGAWREDCEDVVYGISSASPPAISGVWNGTIAEMAALIGGSDPNDAFVSSTHFWYADNGDELATDLCGHTTLGSFKFTIPNAYQKIQKYANGYWDVNCRTDYIFEAPDGHKARLVVIATGQIIGRFQYHGLIDVFKNRDVYVHLASGAYMLQTDQGNVFNYTFSGWQGFLLNNDAKDRIVWEIVGRMCHLLQDLGSPAHANDNPHGGNGLRHDSFEEYFGDIGWTADMVYAQTPAMLDPYVSSNPLHLLMYTMQQQANHFASNGPVGDMQPNNNTFGGNPLPEELTYLNNLNISSYGNPTTVQESIPEVDILNERDNLFPQVIRETAALLYWFGKETGLITPFTVNISRTFEFDPTESLSINSLGGCLAVSTPAAYTKNGRQYVFAGWSDVNGSNPRMVYAAANLTALYKMVHKSNDASAFANNSQRKFVRTSTTTPWYHQVYTSMGHVWIEHSTDGVSWTLGNGGLPLDNGAGKLPSIACNGESVAAVFQEQYGSTWQIVVETFNLTGGSYSKGIRANVWLDTSPYSNNVNPNIAWNTKSDGSPVCVITWEKGGIYYVYGRLGSLSFYEDTWGQLAGTDANSISTSLSSVRIGQNQEPTWKIAWQQRVGSSYAFIKYAEFAFYYTGTWNFVWAMSPIQISSSSVMNNYQPSMICDASNNWYACWIGDVNGTGDPTTVKVIYTNKSAKSSNVYYMYGMNTMPKSCAINISNTGVGCYFAWSASQPSYSNKFVDVGNTGVIKTLNTSGKDIQMCGGAQTGMSVSAYYPFSTPYYFAKSGNLTTLPKTSPNAVATERGCFIGKGDAHLFYSFGNILVNNTPVDFVETPDTVRYDGLEKINAVMVSQPIQISPTSKFTFTEFSSSADSSSLMSVLADTGYVRYRIDLVDNVTGGVIGTVKNTMLTKANPVEEAGTTYSLDTKNIGTRTVKAKITISTNLDGPDIALVKSFSESNAVTAASAQSITLQPVTVITDYSLDQNFPNPFNPSTQISYSIPKDGMVMLKIFDALGREVETLVNEAQTVGRYEVTFDGSRLSSGVYFYRLVSGEKVITKKMLMIK